MFRYPPTLSDEAEIESYEFYDKHIGSVPRNAQGKFDLGHRDMQHTAIDAFRHAYVSGVFTHEYGENVAWFLGVINEITDGSLRSRNMDLWNNEVGRRYALKVKTRQELAEALKKALENGELIISLSDERVFAGKAPPEPIEGRSVVVLAESKTGANEYFYDLYLSAGMSRDEFLNKIHEGNYPGYTTRVIKGVEYPVSKADGDPSNNLG